MKRALLPLLLTFSLIGAAPASPTPAPATTAAPVVVTAQLLDYERGWIFITTGDGFHVAPDATVTGGTPHVRSYARLTFDPSGVVTKIEVSDTKLPPEGNLADVHRFAVTLSPPAPNPELAAPPAGGRCGRTRGGKLVGLTITVQVPPNTPLTSDVFMTSDQSGWNPQAYRLDRMDALHYRTTLKLYSGTQMHVLFDRGSTQSMQVQENGIEQQPFLICIGDEDAQAFTRTVYRWADDQGTTQQVPSSFPTPYHPEPFPNLPPPPRPSPAPLAK